MTWLKALLAMLAALCTASGAWAHATLVSTTPADAASLERAPSEIVLRFDEPVAPLVLQLLDERGAAVPFAGTASEGATVRISLAPLRHGAYIFSFRVASADSHPVSGAIAFNVGAVPSRITRIAQGNEAPEIDAGLWAARAARDLLLLFACGAALFAAWVAAFPLQRAVLTWAGAGAFAAALCELHAQGTALLGATVSLYDAMATAANTTAGRSCAGICAGTALISLGAWVRRPAARKALLLAGAIAAGGAVALSGHAASAHPTWISMPAIACHVLAAAFWVGSLIALKLLLRSETPALVRALQRFSAIAIPAVFVLMAAGTAFTAMQIESVQHLRESRYGNLIALKALLLAALLALAACNRYVLAPRAVAGEQEARVWLGRSIALELLIVIGVVSLTAVLSRTPPRGAAPAQYQLNGQEAYRGSVTISPARAGANTIIVRLLDATGLPLEAQEARLLIANATAGVEPIERELLRIEPGVFRHEGTEMSFAGSWLLSVQGRRGEFDRVVMQAQVQIQ